MKDNIFVVEHLKKEGRKNWLTQETKDRILIPKNENKNSLNEYSSGRIEIWKNCYRILIQHKYFFGFGPQADRYLITKYLKNDLHASWGNNASNAFLYSLLSAGVFGIFFIIYIYIKSIKLLLLYAFRVKKLF